MKRVRLAMALTALLAIAGCGATRAPNVYEGLKTRERIVHPQERSPADELPAYPEYQAERKRVVK